jgi:hypothetical protein
MSDTVEVRCSRCGRRVAEGEMAGRDDLVVLPDGMPCWGRFEVSPARHPA